MTLETIAAPEPAAGQIRIRNRASALNFFDILQCQGKYQVKPPFPFTVGAEVAGIVDAVGEGVTTHKPGDAVVAMTHGGGLAEYSLAPVRNTFPLPKNLGFAEAAAMPIVYHTSYFALTHRTQVKPGEWLLVHAGASGVGMSAIQIGKALGARVIATAGSEDKLAFSKAQGADHVLNYTDGTWVEAVKELTAGRGADIIYDPVGADIFDLSTKTIAPEGRLLVIGFAAGRIPSIQVNRILLKNISIVGVLWGGWVQSHPAYPAEVQKALEALYVEGKINPVVAKTYALEEAPKAMRDLADRKVIGKAVLVMPS